MAAGDIYSNMHESGGTITVQPAGSTRVMITFIGGSEHSQLYGGNSFVGFYNLQGSLPSGGGSNSKYVQWMNGQNNNMKLFIDNTHYIQFQSGSGTSDYSYSGIEI
jgi:hypothetical protein